MTTLLKLPDEILDEVLGYLVAATTYGRGTPFTSPLLPTLHAVSLTCRRLSQLTLKHMLKAITFIIAGASIDVNGWKVPPYGPREKHFARLCTETPSLLRYVETVRLCSLPYQSRGLQRGLTREAYRSLDDSLSLMAQAPNLVRMSLSFGTFSESLYRRTQTLLPNLSQFTCLEALVLGAAEDESMLIPCDTAVNFCCSPPKLKRIQFLNPVGPTDDAQLRSLRAVLHTSKFQNHTSMLERIECRANFFDKGALKYILAMNPPLTHLEVPASNSLRFRLDTGYDEADGLSITSYDELQMRYETCGGDLEEILQPVKNTLEFLCVHGSDEVNRNEDEQVLPIDLSSFSGLKTINIPRHYLLEPLAACADTLPQKVMLPSISDEFIGSVVDTGTARPLEEVLSPRKYQRQW